jgi:mono/diheme cytochrome c family protein
MTEKETPRQAGASGYLGASGLAFLFILATVGPSALHAQVSASPAARAQPAEAPSASSTVGASLFRTSCLKCHDSDGRGEVSRAVNPSIPDFTDPRWQATRTDQQLEHSILEGRGKSMPPMKDKLKPDHVVRLISLIRAFRGGQQVIPDEETPAPPAAPPATAAKDPQDSVRRTAEANFRRTCITCHDADGRGNKMRSLMPELPDFTNPTWQGRRSRSQLVASVLEGKGSRMPAFRDKLGAEQSRAVVDFVRGFGPAQAGSAEAPPDDFDARLSKLQQEFQSLQREYRALSPRPTPSQDPPQTPGVPKR